MNHDHRPVFVAVGEERTPAAALTFAAEVALRHGAPLELVHAYDGVPHGPLTGLDDVVRAERIAAAALQLALERAAELIGSRVPVRGHLVHLPVVRGIVEAVEAAQLVVLERGDEKRGGPIGTRSISSGVAARTAVPVVVVPQAQASATQRFTGRVVVGVDVPERSRSILDQAFAAAAARGVAVRVVHTWWFPGRYDDLVMSREATESFATTARARLDSVLDGVRREFPAVQVEVDVRQARPADALVESSTGAALLVIGRHDALVPQGSHLGPVARAVLRAASCPVLLTASHPHRAARVRTPDQAVTGRV